ncbi:hypothetical protein D3C86_1767560 [compost metagenome]
MVTGTILSWDSAAIMQVGTILSVIITTHGVRITAILITTVIHIIPGIIPPGTLLLPASPKR